MGHTMMKSAVLAVLSIGFLNLTSAAQQAVPEGNVARMIVTAEPRHGSTVPAITRNDVTVYQGRDRADVVDWRPLQGDQAALELFVLIDDGLDPSVGGQIDVLRKFIASQPATTAVGVGYVQNGQVSIGQNLTLDHNQAAKALRIPLGSSGIPGSPYTAIQELIGGWPYQQTRREIVLLSPGIDGLYNGGGMQDPYVLDAITAAQKGGVVVFSIYAPAAGHFGHSMWRGNSGQNYLSQLSEETGGESYGLFMGAPVSIAPNLDDISRKLANQYLLAFVSRPQRKAGAEGVSVKTQVPDVDLLAADQVYAPAG